MKTLTLRRAAERVPRDFWRVGPSWLQQNQNADNRGRIAIGPAYPSAIIELIMITPTMDKVELEECRSGLCKPATTIEV